MRKILWLMVGVLFFASQVVVPSVQAGSVAAKTSVAQVSARENVATVPGALNINARAGGKSATIGDWVTVGDPQFSPPAAYTSLVIDPATSTPYVAFLDRTNLNIAVPTVMSFNGSSWISTGAVAGPMSSNNAPRISLAIAPLTSTLYVAYFGEAVQTIVVKKLVGNNWQNVGTNGIVTSSGTVQDEKPFLTIDPATSIPYVVYRDAGLNAFVKSFNGTNWVQVGSSVTSNALFATIAVGEPATPYVLYHSSSDNKLYLKQYNGTSWVPVPAATNGLVTIADNAFFSLAFDRNTFTPYVAFGDSQTGGNGRVLVKKFNGAAWELVGSGPSLWISAGVGQYISIAFDQSTSAPYVGYGDVGFDSKVFVKKFNGSAWVPVGLDGVGSGSSANYISMAVDPVTAAPFIGYQDSFYNVYKITVARFGFGISASANPVCAGTAVTFNVTSVIPGVTGYQWIVNGGIVGTNSPTYTYFPSNQDHVSCAVSFGTNTDTLGPVIMIVNACAQPSVSITAGPSPVCAGAPLTVTATAANAGSGATYQWSTDGGVNWTASVPPTNAVYTFNPTTTPSVTVQCKMFPASGGAPVLSNIVTTPVTASLPVTATLHATIPSPWGSSVPVGTTVSHSVTVTNGGDAPFYQWQISPAMQPWQNIGSNSPNFSYTFMVDTQVKCIVTSNAPCATGNPASTEIHQITTFQPVVMIQTQSTAVCSGELLTVTAMSSNAGTGATYQWSTDGGVNWTASVPPTNEVYTFNPTTTPSVTVQCKMFPAAGGTPVLSNIVTTSVNPTLPVSVTITPLTAYAGTPVAFTALAVNPGASTPSPYQWQIKHTGTDWQNIPGANAVILPAAAYAVGDMVRCMLTSNIQCPVSNPVYSNEVPILLATTPITAQISASANPVCGGTSVTYTLQTNVPSGANTFYQWQVNGGNQGANQLTFTWTPANGDLITCIVTTSDPAFTGSPTTSNVITATVNENLPVSVTISASANPVPAGALVTFTATPVNPGSQPHYQWMVDGQPQGPDNYQFTYAPINGQQVTCRLTSSEICTSGNPADSDPITMSVKPIVITGTIHGPAGVLPVVTIQVTDASGNLFSPDKSTFTQTPTGEYTVTVSPEYDTTVTAQPVLAGYNFIGTAPENMGLDKGTYTHVIASITGQDYNAKPLDPKMFIIEGEIILKAMDMPLDKVILTLKGTLNGDPWPKDPPQYLQYVTGADGAYKFLVPEGWTGQVVAVKSLYSLYSVVPGFQASNFVDYSPVMQDWPGQDYMAESAVGTSVKIKIAGQIIPKPNEFGNLAAIRIYVVQNGKKFEVAKTDDTGHYVFEINAPFTGQVMPLHSDLAIRSTANINNSYRSYTAQAFSLDREDYYAMKRVGSPKTVAK